MDYALYSVQENSWHYVNTENIIAGSAKHGSEKVIKYKLFGH